MPIAAIGGKLWEVPAGGWKYIVLLAVLTGTVCHGLLAWAQTRVPVSTIAILQVGNPALATLWAYLVLGETMNGARRVGMAVVIGALAAFTSRAGERYHRCSTTGSSEDRRAERVAAATDPRT